MSDEDVSAEEVSVGSENDETDIEYSENESDRDEEFNEIMKKKKQVYKVKRT